MDMDARMPDLGGGAVTIDPPGVAAPVSGRDIGPHTLIVKSSSPVS
jgi:hypothetical protein